MANSGQADFPLATTLSAPVWARGQARRVTRSGMTRRWPGMTQDALIVDWFFGVAAAPPVSEESVAHGLLLLGRRNRCIQEI